MIIYCLFILIVGKLEWKTLIENMLFGRTKNTEFHIQLKEKKYSV